MVDIRTADPEDAAAMVRVHGTSLREQGAGFYDEDQLERLAPADHGPDALDGVFGNDDRYAVVAEHDGDVVGFGGVRLDDGSLLGVYVDPGYAGRGIGRMLLDAVEARARNEGLDVLTVFAALNAAGFYEACGFRRVGERDVSGVEGPLGSYGSASDDSPLPAVEMRKELR